MTHDEPNDSQLALEPETTHRAESDERLFWLVPVVLSLFGVLLLLYFTRFGAWTTGDAVHYIAGARSLIAGDIFGYPAADGIRPIVAFPPFLSTVLAAIGSFGLDPLHVIRYLNSALFGVNIALTWLITYRFSGSKVTAGLIGVWFLLSRIMMSVHGAAMSEALFISLILVSAYALGRFVDDDRMAWILFGGISTGLAILTRFAGLALATASITALILFWKRDPRDKLKAAAIFIAPALLPFAYWSLRNSRLTNTATARPIEWLMTRTRLALSLSEASSWVLGDFATRRIQILIMATLLALLFGAATYLAIRMYRDKDLAEGLRWFPMLMLTSITFYIAMLFASMAFLDATLRITQRYLSPALAMAMIMTGILANWVIGGAGSSPKIWTSRFPCISGATGIQRLGDPTERK